ncbi:GNAT family N-acetyltransferase [Nostoc sp. CHAB 5715]|uniref:GNAT family N-acetyltransferase n=1 Tax=Nostoc sp. CHAB 5715 TaxID=2780400 RepID=UPI001E57DC9C|nr:GNAT family N-acetyltransferase [Nostoc sp. CHAB 5715]MCC5624530.1 GNAT family N-acetyltransferase [Nostoc sp. CHAB 5715]
MSEVVKSDIKVRSCLSSDAESVLKVHRAAIHQTASSCYPKEIIQDWASPITPSKIKAFADNTVVGEETRIVAEINGRIVGFGAIVVSNNELRAVYVSPSFGRSGVGTAILQELERLAREQGFKIARVIKIIYFFGKYLLQQCLFIIQLVNNTQKLAFLISVLSIN